MASIGSGIALSVSFEQENIAAHKIVEQYNSLLKIFMVRFVDCGCKSTAASNKDNAGLSMWGHLISKRLQYRRVVALKLAMLKIF